MLSRSSIKNIGKEFSRDMPCFHEEVPLAECTKPAFIKDLGETAVEDKELSLNAEIIGLMEKRESATPTEKKDIDARLDMVKRQKSVLVYRAAGVQSLRGYNK